MTNRPYSSATRQGGGARARRRLRPHVRSLVERLIRATRRPADWRTDYEPAKRAIDRVAEDGDEQSLAIRAFIKGVAL